MQAVTAPGPKLAFKPSADGMPDTEIVPSGSTLGRCWVSLPAPKKRELPKAVVAVETGYGRPLCNCPRKPVVISLVNQRRMLRSVHLPVSNVTPKVAEWRMSLNAGPNSAPMLRGSPGSDRPKKSSPGGIAAAQV